MTSISTIASSNFRESAVRTFLFFWNDFQRKVKGIDRRADENVFRQMQHRYADALKTSLQQAAEKLVNDHGGNKSGLRSTLHEQVANNVAAFVVRVNTL